MTDEHRAATWTSTEADRFDWRCWDGEGVVYVLATGATHELGATASGVLSVLLQHPGAALGEADLLAALDEEPGAPGLAAAEPDETELRTLRELLRHMAGMGLVVRHALDS